MVHLFCAFTCREQRGKKYWWPESSRIPILPPQDFPSAGVRNLLRIPHTRSCATPSYDCGAFDWLRLTDCAFACELLMLHSGCDLMTMELAWVGGDAEAVLKLTRSCDLLFFPLFLVLLSRFVFSCYPSPITLETLQCRMRADSKTRQWYKPAILKTQAGWVGPFYSFVPLLSILLFFPSYLAFAGSPLS